MPIDLFAGSSEISIMRSSANSVEVYLHDNEDELSVQYTLREMFEHLEITAEDCKKAFEEVEQAHEQRDTTMDGVELETMDATDAEALRRCTFDE